MAKTRKMAQKRPHPNLLFFITVPSFQALMGYHHSTCFTPTSLVQSTVRNVVKIQKGLQHQKAIFPTPWGNNRASRPNIQGNSPINRGGVRNNCDANGVGKTSYGGKSVEETFPEARQGKKISCPFLLSFYYSGKLITVGITYIIFS